jgi:hypothetical protein
MSISQGDRYASVDFESRISPRKRLAVPVKLRIEGAKDQQSKLRDLSLSGFSASAMYRVAIGSSCWLTLPDREAMPARVIWWDRGLVGCAFDKAIGTVTYNAILEHWAAQHQGRR